MSRCFTRKTQLMCSTSPNMWPTWSLVRAMRMQGHTDCILKSLQPHHPDHMRTTVLEKLYQHQAGES